MQMESKWTERQSQELKAQEERLCATAETAKAKVMQELEEGNVNSLLLLNDLVSHSHYIQSFNCIQSVK